MRRPVTETPPQAGDEALGELARQLEGVARRLGRSLSIREVDAGSCNGCELEINALNNAFYDLERFGLRFIASPRHPDVLLVTGPVTKNMREALERTYRATPDPKWAVALGDCAADGGIFAGSYAVTDRIKKRPATCFDLVIISRSEPKLAVLRMVDHEPIFSDVADRFSELLEIDRFDDVTVGAAFIGLHDVSLLT
jgi:Ni,Fe-hydrogenase III small subunit